MAVSRRRLLKSMALAAGSGTAVEAAEPSSGIDAIRNVSAAHGTNLTDDRLRVVQPVLEQRLSQLQDLRAFEPDDAVEPTQGI
jgi:hypothetical protein